MLFVRKNRGGVAEVAHSATETETLLECAGGREKTGVFGNEVAVKLTRLPSAS